MAWYRAGSVSLTNGSTTVTGSGTAFIANASIGEGFNAPDGRTYEVVNIVSDTSLTISPAYLGSTASGQAYAIAPLRGRIADLLAETQSLLGSFATVRDGIGAGLFPDGTVSLPGLRFASDQDTGIRRTGSNSMAMVTGGVDRLAVVGDRVGIGTTAPSTLFHVNNPNVETGYSQPMTIRQTTGAGTHNEILIGQFAAGVMFLEVIDQANTKNELRLQPFGGAVSVGAVLRPSSDNAVNLGGASNRWATVFAATGTINTSDEREKTWRGPATAPELIAARRIVDAFGFFQWNDAIAEKGEDGARMHFGVKAQAVWEIMAEEGLIDPIGEDGRPGATPYAFLCFDEWEAEPGVPAVAEVRDEDGTIIVYARPAIAPRPAGNRFGLRIDQLTMFLLAALAQRVAALEAAR